MPRYRYVCEACESEKMIFHLFGEEIELNCAECETEDSLRRALTSPTYVTHTPQHAVKVGEITEEYIEKNREILEQEKREAKEATYEQN
jgi:hypothetical protein